MGKKLGYKINSMPASKKYRKCPVCKGKGTYREALTPFDVDCPVCDGSGKQLLEWVGGD